MEKEFDLLSLGEVLLRLSPPSNERLMGGETFQKQVGGAELNVVSGVSLLGLRTGIISKLPDMISGHMPRTGYGFAESAMIIWFMMTQMMQDLACIIMKMVPSRENRELCMTECTLQ